MASDVGASHGTKPLTYGRPALTQVVSLQRLKVKWTEKGMPCKHNVNEGQKDGINERESRLQYKQCYKGERKRVFFRKTEQSQMCVHVITTPKYSEH